MSFVLIANNIGLLGFSLSSLLFLVALQNNKYSKLINILALLLFGLATLIATFALFHVSSDVSWTYDTGLLLTCCLGWLGLVAYRQPRLRILASFLAPLVTFILLVQIFITPGGKIFPQDQTSLVLISIHVLSAVIGQTFATIACVLSLLFLWKRHLLKKKLIEQITGNLPSLDKLELYLIRCLWAGFIPITISLVSGAIFSQIYVEKGQLNLEVKTIWAICVWLWYLIILLSKNVFYLPRKYLAIMSLLGFGLLAISYFGMGFFRPFGGP